MPRNQNSSPPSKLRLLALDGIRGFAALSVVVSHLGFNTRVITDSPVVSYLFRIISAGPTSVQLFFVLSGFLMAYLYPSVAQPQQFWQKRYLRIMPLFAVVVLGIALSYTYLLGKPNIVILTGMLAVAVLMHIAWRLFAVIHQRWPIFAQLLFFGFIGLQIALFSLSLLTAIGPGEAFLLSLSKQHRYLFTILSNLTMTMYWQQELFVMEGVFWSLVPEVMFYLLYPLVAAPLILVGSRLKPHWNVLLVGITLLMLFQLDTASRALYSLHGIFISRATGFVVGIVLGCVYRIRPSWWIWFSNKLQSKYLAIPILLLFAITMAWEWPDRYHQIRHFVMLHYLGLSVLFGILVAAALQTGSLIERVFAKKPLVFLGMISYSLYLTHPFVINRLEWSNFMQFFQNNLTEPTFEVVRGAILTGGSILFATVLYYLVESLYFRKSTHPAPISRLSLLTNTVIKKIGRRPLIVLCGSIVIAGFTALYSTDAVPSLMLSRHSLGQSVPAGVVYVTENQSQQIMFTAQHSHLSAIQLAMDYAHDPNIFREETTEPLQLVFTLKDAEGNIIVESKRHPQELAGEPQFPFGFPTQVDSAGKTYYVTLALQQATFTDEVAVYPQTGLVAQYTTDHLPTSATKILQLVTARVWFAVWRWEFMIAITAVLVVSALLWKPSQKPATS